MSHTEAAFRTRSQVIPAAGHVHKLLAVTPRDESGAPELPDEVTWVPRPLVRATRSSSWSRRDSSRRRRRQPLRPAARLVHSGEPHLDHIGVSPRPAPGRLVVVAEGQSVAAARLGGEPAEPGPTCRPGGAGPSVPLRRRCFHGRTSHVGVALRSRAERRVPDAPHNYWGKASVAPVAQRTLLRPGRVTPVLVRETPAHPGAGTPRRRTRAPHTARGSGVR